MIQILCGAGQPSASMADEHRAVGGGICAGPRGLRPASPVRSRSRGPQCGQAGQGDRAPSVQRRQRDMARGAAAFPPGNRAAGAEIGPARRIFCPAASRQRAREMRSPSRARLPE
jgi:hypothetical protein